VVATIWVATGPMSEVGAVRVAGEPTPAVGGGMEAPTGDGGPPGALAIGEATLPVVGGGGDDTGPGVSGCDAPGVAAEGAGSGKDETGEAPGHACAVCPAVQLVAQFVASAPTHQRHGDAVAQAVQLVYAEHASHCVTMVLPPVQVPLETQDWPLVAPLHHVQAPPWHVWHESYCEQPEHMFTSDPVLHVVDVL